MLSIIRGNYVILLTLGHFHYSLIKQKVHKIKSMTHLKVFCWNIFERDFSDATLAPTRCASFYFQKSLSQIELGLYLIGAYFYCKSFLSHAAICDWPVRIGRSFMGTIALATVNE